MELILLLTVSIIPVLVLALYINKKDKHKEPSKLLLKLLFGGAFISVAITLLITAQLEILIPFFSIDTDKLNYVELLISVFIGVALIEEFSKWFVVYRMCYKNKEFDEFYDMIVYCVFVSLGFALLENLVYVLDEGLGTGILRAFLAVPGHAFLGVFMGYYLGLAKMAANLKNKKLEKKNKMFSIIIPVILHGMYDYFVLSEHLIFLLIFFVYIAWLYTHALKKVNKISKLNTEI